MGVKAFVLAGYDCIAEIAGHVLEQEDLAFLPVYPADFGALPVEDDRSLRHLVYAVQIIVCCTESIDYGEDRQKAQPCDRRYAREAREEARGG